MDNAAKTCIHPNGRRDERGFTIAELAFAFVIMVTAALALVSHVSSVYRRNTGHQDRVFAYTKASSILAELQSWVNRDETASANSLDTLDDGTSYNPVLTITRESGVNVKPGHPMSGNRLGVPGWMWARRITVRPFPGLDNRNVRYVTVKIFRNRGEGRFELLADLSGVVNSVGSAFPPTQEYDVYLVAIENIPGWWVHMDAIRPFIESTISDLEARNPGAKIRTHWITKASYGRNRLYTPYINASVDSKTSIPYVYMYPGKMPSGSASAYYYVPALIKGRMQIDGVTVNGYNATDNPHPYALADSFNHAMRYEDEKRFFDQRVAAGLESEDEPTLRLLLEDMASRPEKYHNAILVNLHGELLPMPALRNYSDAAKSPVKYPELRVVTHPEQLRVKRGSTVATSDDVTLRVYAYRTKPQSTDKFTEGQPITLQFMNVNLTKHVNIADHSKETLQIERMAGGVANQPYSGFGEAPTKETAPSEMCYTVSWDPVGKFTKVELFNTPSVTPVHSTPEGNQGLDPSKRLYGYDYIPCSTEPENNFGRDLAEKGTVYKNTARWRITIRRNVFDHAATESELDLADTVLTVRTRIGDDLATGVAYPIANEPDNLSSTYVYWTDSAEDVPVTERSQFLGDPRHCPYADLKDGGDDFPNGYNWFFDNFKTSSFNAQSLWPGFDAARLRDSWLQRIDIDWPRYAQLLRHAVTKSEAVFTTLTGFSYYYVGIGGEIGYDAANGYPSSIPVSLLPYGGTGWAYVDNIAINGNPVLRNQKFIRESATTDYWWGKTWLGELCPDSAYATFLASGNLPAGGTTGTFHRTMRSLIDRDLPPGTYLDNSNRSLRPEGSTSVFNTGQLTSTFHHQFASPDSQGKLVGAGNELAKNYNFPMPTTTKISRPFGIDLAYHGGVGDEWWFPSDYPRYTTAIVKSYYQHDSGLEGSAVVGLTSPDGNSTAHIVVNGLTTTLDSGTSFIAKYAVLSLIHSYFEAGHPSVTNKISLPPRLEILGPTEITELDDPTEVQVTWSTTWRRWDGRPYSESFADTYTQDESVIEYVLLYSDDGGKTFKYMKDGTSATPGIRPGSAYLRADEGDGDESFKWGLPSDKFPEGSYVLRVEAYRANESLHYSYHQVKVFVQR